MSDSLEIQRAWWTQAEETLGAKLYGFSGLSWASFKIEDVVFSLPASVVRHIAERIANGQPH